MRLYSPAAFWKLLKPPSSQPSAAPADLHAHYCRLLSELDPTYTPEIFISGWETSQEATITPEEVQEAVQKLRHNKALGNHWLFAELL